MISTGCFPLARARTITHAPRLPRIDHGVLGRGVRNGSTRDGVRPCNWHKGASANEGSDFPRSDVHEGNVMFNFMFHATERGMVGKRRLVRIPVETVPFDHTPPSQRENAWRVIKNQRRGFGSKGTNVESNLLLFVRRDLPIGGAQSKVAAAPRHEVPTELDVVTVD